MIPKDENKAELLIRDSQKLDLYLKNVKLKGNALKSKILAVIDDKTKADIDSFIICDGIVPVKHSKVDSLRRYDRIQYQGNSIKLGWPDEYNNRVVNLGNLYNMIEALGTIKNNTK